MYANHIPTTIFQKFLLGAGSAAVAIVNPARGDMIATMGEVTALYTLSVVRRKMEADIVGNNILSNKPRITNASVDFDYLRSLPSGTLGREYLRFLENLETTPDDRPPVRFIDDIDLAYVMQRYRETHDLYHVLLELPPNMLGEVVVKWFEGLQFGFPMCITAGLFGAVRLFPKQREKYVRYYLPWVLRAAPRAMFLLNVYWENYWDWTLEDLRRSLNVDDLPDIKSI